MDEQGKYLGLGLEDQISLVGPVSNARGFMDLGNGWYRITTHAAERDGPVYLRFAGDTWEVPMTSCGR